MFNQIEYVCLAKLYKNYSANSDVILEQHKQTCFTSDNTPTFTK